MDYINKNLYIISTVIFVIITAIFFLLSWLMQRKNLRKVFNTRNIAIVALLSALSVVLTNVLGYTFTAVGGTIRLALGNFVIFIVGMIFGPMMGMTSGIVSDSIGALINNGGAYHFGFTMAKALFGFAGSLVFIWKTNKWIVSKTAITFSIYFIIYSFVISPISVLSLYSNMGIVGLYTISKLIRTPIELAIYVPLTIVSFELLIQLIQHRFAKKSFIWAFRKGQIHFKQKKSLYEKQKAKEQVNAPLTTNKKEPIKADKYITK